MQLNSPTFKINILKFISGPSPFSVFERHLKGFKLYMTQTLYSVTKDLNSKKLDRLRFKIFQQHLRCQKQENNTVVIA